MLGPPSSKVRGPGERGSQKPGEKVSRGPGPSVATAQTSRPGMETCALASAHGWSSVTLRSCLEMHGTPTHLAFPQGQARNAHFMEHGGL